MITQTYTISTIKQSTPPIVKMSQYDHGSRTITFSVVDGSGQAVVLTGKTVRVEGTRLDGHAFAEDCTVSGSTATFTDTSDMTNAPGAHPAELVIESDGDRLGTMNFVISVETAAMDENADITEEDVSLFEQLLGSIEDATGAVEAEKTAALSAIDDDKDAALLAIAQGLASGSPLVVDAVADMTDQTAVYLYSGSESGYTAGNYYFYNGSAWVSGGTYGNPTVDAAFSNSSVNPVQNKVVSAAVSELKSDIAHVGNKYKSDDWVQGTCYYNAQNDKIIVSSSELRCRTPVSKKIINASSISSSDGVQFTVVIYKGTQTSPTDVINNVGWQTEYNISEYSNDYNIVIVARKSDDSAITPTEATNNIFIHNHIYDSINELDGRVDLVEDDIDELNDFKTDVNSVLFFDEIEPDSIKNNQCYYWTNNFLTGVTGATAKKIIISENSDYYVTTSFVGAQTGFPLVSYFDDNDEQLSYEYMNQPGITATITKQKLTIPSGAAWFYVNSRDFTSHIYTTEMPTETFSELIDSVSYKTESELSILLVGNSLTQDGISYLPYLLKTYYPKIKFRIYMWYNGGYNLGQQYQKFINNQACEIFSVAENTSAWTNSSKTMSSILTTYKFDIVCMQEYFNYKESFTPADLADWNNCQSYIRSNYTGGNGLEFICLFHAPLRSSAESVFNLTKTGNGIILQNTIADDMLANGIAVYRALSTDLDNLGDAGHLSPDGTHTQEGLPCLLQTYVTLLWLLDRFGYAPSIYGIPMKMTTAIYNTLNVPGPNLGSGVIEGTDAQNILAQEVAIKAYKEGKQFVINNLYPTT